MEYAGSFARDGNGLGAGIHRGEFAVEGDFLNLGRGSGLCVER